MPHLPGGATLPPMTAPESISYLESLNALVFLPEAAPDAETLAREADDRLFKSILLDPNHVLRKHFPETKPTNYNFRPRAHALKVPLNDDRNCVPRLLFKDMYEVV